jgi:hypothetical protein
MVRGGNRHEPIDVPRVLHWSNYSAKAVARVQARGMPIDMHLWNLVQENKEAVIAELIRRFDPSCGTPFPIYTPDGEWAYDRFERWLVFAGVRARPRLNSGRLDTSADAFRLMYSVVPGLEGLHALRDSLGFIVKARLPSSRLACRSVGTPEPVHHYFHLQPQPAETRTRGAPTMLTPACGRSCCSTRT